MGHQGKSKRAGAILALELLFVFPIMMAIFFGTVEFGLLLAAEARLMNASREGTRVAAAGGNFADVQAAVKAALPTAEQNLVDINAKLFDVMSNPLLPGDPVSVMVSAKATDLVPDYLRFICFSISGKCLIGQTVMRKE